MSIKIRPLLQSDFPLYCSLYSDENIMKYIGKPFSEEQCVKSFNKYFSESYQSGLSQIAVIYKHNNGEHIDMGLIQLHFKKKCQRSAEIGIILNLNFTDKGVGQISHNLMLAQAKKIHSLEVIYTRCVVGNTLAVNFCRALDYRCVVRTDKGRPDYFLWFLPLKKHH